MTLECPACGKSVTATEEMVGRTVACPHCAGRMRIAGAGMPAVWVSSTDSSTVSGATTISGATTGTTRGVIRPTTFTFTCQRCKSVLEARGEHAGRAGRCPTCGAVFTVPEVDPRTGVAVGIAEVADDGQLPTPMHAYATAGDRAPKIRRLANGEQVVECPRCRREMAVDANTCETCGLPFTIEGAAAARSSTEMSNSHAVWALTAGVVSIMTYCLPVLGVAAIALGIAGIRRADRYRPLRPGRNMAIAGIVLGLVSIVMFASLRIGIF